uniref:Phosphoprotein n=1 Tax=Caprine parainfluenza virus 3 TaxID=1529392 RepID=A0A2Z5BXK6_9MONO|nr:phosphoprotein [Caprine parainfluenza virus 3]
MDNNAEDNKIMDSWEERAENRSADISSALDIIEFILNNDTQENANIENRIETGEVDLSATIPYTKFQTTEPYKKDSRSTDKNRWSRTSHKYTTKTESGDVDQEVVQRRDRRGSSTDNRIEIMGIGRLPRGIADPEHGSQIQENTDHDEVRKVDKDPLEREIRQLEDVPIKISGGDTIPSAEQGGDSNDGGSLEFVSAPYSRGADVITIATPSDEEELLAKNTRQRKNPPEYQQDNQEIKKGKREEKKWSKGERREGQQRREEGEKREREEKIETGRGIDPVPPLAIQSPQIGASRENQTVSESQTKRTDPTKTTGGNQRERPTPLDPCTKGQHTQAHRLSHGAQRSTGDQSGTFRPKVSTQESQVESRKKSGEEKKNTEESTQYTEKAITLLQSLGVIQSAAKLDLYQDKRIVYAANVLNNVDIASKIDFLAGLMIGVSIDNDNKLNQIQNEIMDLKNDLKRVDESHRRLIENQKEQLSLIISLISNLKIITERGGRKDQTELSDRMPMVRTKTKEEKAKKVRFDPLMESQGDDRNIPDLYRNTEKAPENDQQIRSDIHLSNNDSNATRLVPKRTNNTMRSLAIIINNSNLSATSKQSYINELKLCKSDEEVSELMELFNEDINSQ